MSSRAITGNVTKQVASTRPGKAKTILMSCSRSHGPKMPWRPNSSSRNKPTTTGDTVKGRSISAVSAARPGNLKRAMAHAAARPKIVLRIDRGRRDRERQEDRVEGVGVADEILPVDRDATGERLDEDVHERHHDEQRHHR